MDDDGKLLETEGHDNLQYLGVAHILPHCPTKVASGDEDFVRITPAVSRVSLTGLKNESKKNVAQIKLMSRVEPLVVDSSGCWPSLTNEEVTLVEGSKLVLFECCQASRYRINDIPPGTLPP